MDREKISFETPGCLGDWLCMLSAAREYARRHPNEEVFVTNLSDVADAYGDGLVKGGRCTHHVVVNAVHREKYFSTRHNYLGTFLREICPEITVPMTLELPRFASSGDSIAVIQPYSGFAPNPATSYLQRLVDTFIEKTRWPLFAIGHTRTVRDLRNVDYSLLSDSVPDLLRNLSRARFVMTPRSASAHAAAGYGIPAFVWLPDDGENWHLNYPGWNSVKIPYRDGVDSSVHALATAISSIEAFR